MSGKSIAGRNILINPYRPLFEKGQKKASYRIDNLFANDSFKLLSYSLKKGVMMTFSHQKNEDGTFRVVPVEMISHFIMKGKVQYTTSKGTSILGPGDNIIFYESMDDVSITVLSMALIFVAQTSTVTSTKQRDKIIDDKLKEIDSIDHYTKLHCTDVSSVAVELAMACQQDPNLKNRNIPFLADIAQAASVHDVRKIAIPPAILMKKGKLTPEEYALIKTHVEEGVEILKKANVPEGIIRIVSEHHERLDGSGYPKGLKGEQISMGGRILGYANMFGAMITNRCYRKALSVEQALSIIENDAKTGKLDPDILPVFLNCVKSGRFGSFDLSEK